VIGIANMRCIMAIRGFIAHDRESGAYNLADSGRATLMSSVRMPGLGLDGTDECRRESEWPEVAEVAAETARSFG
jgi:hypothetical protein